MNLFFNALLLKNSAENNPIDIDYSKTAIYLSNFNTGIGELTNNISNSDLSNGKLNINITGGDWTDELYLSKESSHERKRVDVKFTLNSLNSEVFCGIKAALGFNVPYGQYSGIDFSTGNFVMMAGTATVPSSIAETSSITEVSLVAGHDYLMSWQAYRNYYNLILMNLSTGETESYTYTSADPAVARGYAAVSVQNGDISLEYLRYYTMYYKSCDFILVGDSITDGYSILNDLTASLDDRWAVKLWNENNNKYAISGWGGNTSSDLYNRFDPDVIKYTPKYVFIFIGTNDSNFNTWLNNISNMLVSINNIGAIPVFGLIYPVDQSYSIATHTSINSWIKSSGYMYVNFAEAMSVNGDEVTGDFDNLYISDNVHPNKSGHLAIYNKFKNFVNSL